MRLIDADVLKEKICEEIRCVMDTYCGSLPDDAYGDLETLEQETIIKLFDEQPTVETGSIWIPCSESMPEDPEENPVFDNKCIEVYLVSMGYDDYPFRAFWNGKYFTDGFEKLNVIAWQPLPEPYKGD